MGSSPPTEPQSLPPGGGIMASIWGAIFLARFDARGLDLMDLSRRGFWPSFTAAIIVAPLHIIYLRSFYDQVEDPFDPTHAAMIEALAYTISWVIIPVLMWEVLGWIGKREKFCRYVIAYNWATVVQNALMMPIVYFAMEGHMDMQAGQILWLFALFYILAYVGFVLMKTLDITAIQASGLVAMDLLVGLMLNDLAALMIFRHGTGLSG